MVAAVDILGGDGSPLPTPLMNILMADDVQPGTDGSYQLMKDLFVYHPLGLKIAQSPVTMAQSEAREVTVQDAPEEVLQAFLTEWEEIGADSIIHNIGTLSRVYGTASLIVGCEGVSSEDALDMKEIWKKNLFFNVLDPLNTAGSLVLNQISTAADFLKPSGTISTQGQRFHRSRHKVLINEHPVFLSYTTSAWGFTGRSVFLRALFPLKTFIRSMIADDMIQTKLGVLILKKEAGQSTIDRATSKIVSFFRWMLKIAQTGNVISMGVNEDVTTLNMQNVDGAGTYARTNTLKNVATACDMPAKLVANEALVEGFGEGQEDAKMIAAYIGTIRKWLQPVYAFFDNIVRYRAWNPEFCEAMRQQYPEAYGKMTDAQMFSKWKRSFKAVWPSLLKEAPSEQVNVEKTKFESLISTAQLLLQTADPENKARVLEWISDTINQSEKLFPVGLDLDLDLLREHLEEMGEQEQMMAMGGPGGPGAGGAQPKGLPTQNKPKGLPGTGQRAPAPKAPAAAMRAPGHPGLRKPSKPGVRQAA